MIIKLKIRHSFVFLSSVVITLSYFVSGRFPWGRKDDFGCYFPWQCSWNLEGLLS